MAAVVDRRWESKRTDETRKVEEALKAGGFQHVDAYRYNSATIRVRVIDPRFRDQDIAERDAMVEEHLKKLPERTQADIVTLLTFSPEELSDPHVSLRSCLLNAEFENPSPSSL
jgi:hypothetical protein